MNNSVQRGQTVKNSKEKYNSHMFCFTFVSDSNTDYLMLYSVQLENMYSYLDSSLKLSDIVRGLSCQQSYCNLLSLYKLITIIPFFLSYNFLPFPSTSCLV